MSQSWASFWLPFLLWEVVDAAAGHISRPTPTTKGSLDNFLDNRAPAITAAPQRRQLGVMDEKGLFARQFDQGSTCGYFNGGAGSPFVCNSGSMCGFWVTESGYNPPNFGCCPETLGAPNFSECDYITTCVPWRATYSSHTNYRTSSSSLIANNALFCDGPNPYCATYELFYSSNSETYTYYTCTDTTFLYGLLPFPTFTPFSLSASAAPVTSSSIAAAAPTSSSITTPPTTSSSSTIIQSSIPVSVSSSTPTSSSTPATTSSIHSSSNAPLPADTQKSSAGTSTQTSSRTQGLNKSNAASGTSSPTPKPHHSDEDAIIGGVVGGVGGAVVLIGGVIAYLVIRKRKAREQPYREVSQIYYSP